MYKPWIVVADQSKARIFTVDSPRGELQAIGEMEHPEARQKTQAFGSDKPGRAFDSGGQGRHAMGTSVEPKEQEAIRFAKQIGARVRSAHNEGQCDKLLLVAGPHFLGLLRDQLGSVNSLNITEIGKNLGQHDPREIRSHLPERI